MLDALEHAVASRHLTRELVPAAGVDGSVLDLSFASAQWRTTVCAKEQPGMLVRQHFEAMVFTYLVEELRCGDITVVGGEDFGDWTSMLLPWERVEPQIPVFCQQAGLPATADGFVDDLRDQLTKIARAVDAGYPDNADLRIDPVTGVPSLRGVREPSARRPPRRWRPSWTGVCRYGGFWSTWPGRRTGLVGGTASAHCRGRIQS